VSVEGPEGELEEELEEELEGKTVKNFDNRN
jgi:hypothetical protein